MRNLVCTLALAIFAVGCAKNGDSTHKEMTAIQQELGRMRAENAIMMARIEALEAGRTNQAPAATTSKATPTGDDDRPKLEVLRLAPTPEAAIKTDKPNVADETTGEVEPDEPRPVIRSTGRGEVIAQSPRPTKPAPPTRPTTTAAGTPR
jgi:hypothetical protein